MSYNQSNITLNQYITAQKQWENIKQLFIEQHTWQELAQFELRIEAVLKYYTQYNCRLLTAKQAVDIYMDSIRIQNN